jgi:PAS domain S-box-containing protein
MRYRCSETINDFNDVRIRTYEARRVTTIFSNMDPYHALVEQITDYAIVVLDTEGIIRSWNAGARAITGYTEHEALGRPLATLVDEDLVARAVKTGRVSTQCWVTRKAGRPRWTQNIVQLMKAGRGGDARTLCWLCHDPFDI